MKAIKCDRCNRYQESNGNDVTFKHKGCPMKVAIAHMDSMFSFVDVIDLCDVCKVELAALVEEWLHSEE